MKKIVSLLLAVLMTAALFTGCAKQPQAPDQPQEEAVTIRVGGLKGPTSMGLVKLLDDAENQKTANAIDFRMAASANELNPLFLKGELDIMAVPANLGSVLYNKTEGQVKMLAVSTLGVLGVIIGGACYAINTLQNYEMFIKLLILGLFYLLTSPISGHAIAKGAYHHGVKMDEKAVCDKYGEDME